METTEQLSALIEKLEELHDPTTFFVIQNQTGSQMPAVNATGRMAEELMELHNNAKNLLTLAKKGIWAEEAKEALDRISGGEYPRNRMTVIARGALSSFPSIQ
jgi:hypothetical protein